MPAKLKNIYDIETIKGLEKDGFSDRRIAKRKGWDAALMRKWVVRHYVRAEFKEITYERKAP